MAFLRRLRRPAKPPPPTNAPLTVGRPPGDARASSSNSALDGARRSAPAASATDGSGSAVTQGTGSAHGRLNRLPPGMPEMPSTPPAYARLAERAVSGIDDGLHGHGSGSVDSRDSRSSRTRRRIKRVFGRGPRSRRGRSVGGDDSVAGTDDVPDLVCTDSSVEMDAVRQHCQQTQQQQRPGVAGFMSIAAALAAEPCARYDYGEDHLREEDPHSRLRLSDLSTKGRLVHVAEEVTENVRVHDNHISFVVPHGWIATRTPWGFYLSCKDCLGFIMASSAQDASKHLIDTHKLSVLSDVHVMTSPLFQSRHRAVVKYASHDLEGQGMVQYDVGFFPGATVFGLCAPRSRQESLSKVEERLAATAVVISVPSQVDEVKSKASVENATYDSTVLGLSTGTNCVMQ